MKKTVYAALVAIGSFLFASTAMAQYGRDVYRNDDRYNSRDVRQHRGYDDRYNRPGNVYRGNAGYNRRVVVVPWARHHSYNYQYHAYFPDYNLFYDPYRGGYEYRYGNRWVFSQMLPPFLANVNLGRARIAFMTNVPVTRPPHYYYNDYARRYPQYRRGYGY